MTCDLTEKLPGGMRDVRVKVPIDFKGSNRQDWSNYDMVVKGHTSSNQEQPPKKILNNLNLKLSAPIIFNLIKDPIDGLQVTDDEVKASYEDLEDMGPSLDYKIFYRNEGISDINSATIELKYPAKFGSSSSDRTLLYPWKAFVTGGLGLFIF